LFKVKARRDRLFGLWLAAQFGLSGEAADAYAKEVVAADLEKPGDDDVIEKVLRDAAAKGITLTAQDIRHELGRFFAVAKAQIAPE
jgi:hypothetical protein